MTNKWTVLAIALALLLTTLTLDIALHGDGYSWTDKVMMK